VWGEIQEHARIPTRVTNSVVDRAGTTFTFRLTGETGMAAPDVARAHTAAREIYGLRALWAQIAALDDVLETDTQITLLLEVRRLAERATRWLLRNRAQPLDIAATTEFFRPGVQELTVRIFDLPRDDRWQSLARAALREDLHVVHSAITAEVLRTSTPGAHGPSRRAGWRRSKRRREMTSRGVV
jgi:glutamate dehydrogenase